MSESNDIMLGEIARSVEEGLKGIWGAVDGVVENIDKHMFKRDRTNIAAQIYAQLIKSRCESDCFISRDEAWKDNCHVWAEDAVYLADVLIEKLNK